MHRRIMLCVLVILANLSANTLPTRASDSAAVAFQDRFNAVIASFNTSPLETSILKLDSIKDSMPDDLRLHLFLGTAYYQSGDIAKAIEEKEKIFSLKPKIMQDCGYLDTMCIGVKRYMEAIANICDSTERVLREGSPGARKLRLGIARTWTSAYLRPGELLLAICFILIALILMRLTLKKRFFHYVDRDFIKKDIPEKCTAWLNETNVQKKDEIVKELLEMLNMLLFRLSCQSKIDKIKEESIIEIRRLTSEIAFEKNEEIRRKLEKDLKIKLFSLPPESKFWKHPVKSTWTGLCKGLRWLFAFSADYSSSYPDEASCEEVSKACGYKRNDHFPQRYLVDQKQRALHGLMKRDVGPLSFDIATHGDRAEVVEYRGALHWFRDVLEKGLSVFLMCAFCFFLAKAFGYLYAYGNGDTAWRLCFLPLDINIAISIVGFALIIDGLMLVAAMTDAPGISKTIDSLVVVLAGVAVMLIEAEPGEESLVKFSLGDNPWLPPVLAGAIALLFVVRWVVRHHTISEWMGTSDDSAGVTHNFSPRVPKFDRHNRSV